MTVDRVRPASPAGKSDRGLVGIFFCVFALLAFACQDTLIKSLGEQYSVLEILSARNGIVLVILVVFASARRGPSLLRTGSPGPLLLRGVFAFLAFSTYYTALVVIPLAQAAAVFMTAPLFVTVLSAPLLGEQVRPHLWVAVVFGFLAALYILQPGTEMFRVVVALPLFSALCYALVPILTRRIGVREHAVTIAVYASFSQFALCLAGSLLAALLARQTEADELTYVLARDWRWPTVADFFLMLLSGLVFTVGLLSITQAYRIAAVGTVAPFEYAYLVWASLLGFLAFGDVPDARALLGGGAVVCSGLYVMHRERKKRTAGK